MTVENEWTVGGQGGMEAFAVTRREVMVALFSVVTGEVEPAELAQRWLCGVREGMEAKGDSRVLPEQWKG